MSFVSRWMQRISQRSRDGLALSRAMYLAVPRAAPANTTIPERIKAVLLEESRQPSNNSVAISLLKIDKEMGLVKYWGLAEYMRQKQDSFVLPSILSSNSNSSLPENPDSKVSVTDSPGTGAAISTHSASSGAKVAFMITSPMKHDLINNLGYETNIIKGMTPQQASLVLHHRVLPESYDDCISKLEEQFQEEQQKLQEQKTCLQEKEQFEMEKQPREVDVEDNLTTAEIAAIPSDNASNSLYVASHDRDEGYDRDNRVNIDQKQLILSSSQNEELSSLSSDSRLPNDLATESPTLPSTEDRFIPESSVPKENSTDTIVRKEEEDMNLWYEVVEIKGEKASSAASDAGVYSNEVRHGLYRNRDEAMLSLETRQMIKNRRELDTNDNGAKNSTETSSSFVLRPISDEDLRVQS
ncbi:unnamed protein product [Pseudo-nitzschia multistriata]|uniref:Uncharacterized protein n=1 Tax=Pseudo-nitzschia multistriata TaxID=183589 RepID=A0A448ZIT5_9STRA|nr:unnamed protein product [Pseudo-nitzschia multistriata]